MRQTLAKVKTYGILEGMVIYQHNLYDLLFYMEKEW